MIADGKIGLSDVKKAYDAVNPYLPHKETIIKNGKGALNMGQKIFIAIDNIKMLHLVKKEEILYLIFLV